MFGARPPTGTRYVGAAGLALIVASSCRAFVDLGGLDDGPARPDAGATDARSDAIADGGGGDGALPEAAIPLDASGGCATLGVHDFCDDFDQGQIGARWDELVTAAGPITTDNTASVSAPFSALFVASAGSGAQLSCRLGKKMPAHQRFVLAYDLRMDHRTQGEINLGGVALIPPPSGFDIVALSLLMRNGVFSFEEDYVNTPNTGTPEYKTTPVQDPGDAWRHVEMTFSFDQPASASMKFDGVEVFRGPIRAFTSGGETFFVGAPFVDSTQGDTLRVRYDNVTIDLQ